MTRHTPLRITTAATATAAFLEYCVYAYGARQCNPADSEQHFAARFVHVVNGVLGSKPYLFTVYPPKEHGQTKRFSKKAQQRLWHYLEDQ